MPLSAQLWETWWESENSQSLTQQQPQTASVDGSPFPTHVFHGSARSHSTGQAVSSCAVCPCENWPLGWGIFNPSGMKAQAGCPAHAHQQNTLRFILITLSRERNTSSTSHWGKRTLSRVNLPQHTDFPSMVLGPPWKLLKALLFSHLPPAPEQPSHVIIPA